MEKNIHDDRLDDYVKGSFEEYTENPASDMWERIEGQLPPVVERKPFWYLWRSYRWQMAAAAVILLLVTRLVCVQGYYEERLRAVSNQQRQGNQTFLSTPETAHLVPETEPALNSSLPQSLPETANPPLTVSTQPAPKHTTSPVQTLPGGIFEKETRQSAIPVQQVPKTQSIPAAIIPQEPETAAANIVGITLDSSSTAVSLVVLDKEAVLQRLTQKSPSLSVNRNETPNTVPVPTKKFRQSSGWYAGLGITPHLTVEKSRMTVRPGPMSARRQFISQQKHPATSADLSLQVGKKINDRFALETGIGYQHLSRTATHLARFEYREGQTIQNPSGLESRSFDYDLNTYSGSASVSLRMEVSGSDAPAPLERVGALLTSKETMNVVQIPLLGVARLGQGRLKTVLKAGFLGTYLVKNGLEITAYKLENTKLRFRSQQGYSVQLTRPNHFVLGYQLSAGAEFRLNKNLSFAAAPVVSGDFQRKDPLLGKLPGHTAIGMSLGANWWF